MQIINKQDKSYPKNLLKMQKPPENLYVEGNAELLTKNSVAIVGSRKASDYGKKCAETFAKEISKKGLTIVSGMALGIDSTAHINSMQEAGKTIAVLGTTLPPKENYYLYQKILENDGCVVTEYPPETPENKTSFRERNRIISGLSIAVLLVEARYRSGASITAKYAIKQKKELFCIPNRIDETTGYSPNLLIKQGASIATCPQDILDFCEQEQEENVAIPEEYEDIYNLIGEMPISPNEIAKITGKTISQISEALCMLEIENLIKNIPGNKYVRT